MRRFTVVDIQPKIYEVIEERKEMCNKVLDNPKVSEMKQTEAKNYLAELEAFENFLETIKSLAKNPYSAISQDDEGSSYFEVKYVESQREFQKLFKEKSTRKDTEIVTYDKDYRVTWDPHGFERDRYINLFEAVFSICVDGGSNYFFEQISRRITKAVTSEEFEKIYIEALQEMLVGQHSLFYVTLRKTFLN